MGSVEIKIGKRPLKCVHSPFEQHLLSVASYTSFSITKHYNIEIYLSSIAQSTGQYFPVLVQLYWEYTVKYTPSRAGAIFSSILPALLGVYWKIYPQLYWEYIFQYTPSRAGPIRENISHLIEQYWS